MENLINCHGGRIDPCGMAIEVAIMDGCEIPKFVFDVLLLVTKQPVRYKFNDVHLLPDVDKLVCKIREKNTEVEESS